MLQAVKADLGSVPTSQGNQGYHHQGFGNQGFGAQNQMHTGAHGNHALQQELADSRSMVDMLKNAAVSRPYLYYI